MLFSIKKPENCNECLFYWGGLGGVNCTFDPCIFKHPELYKKDDTYGIRTIVSQKVTKDTAVSKDEFDYMSKNKSELNSFMDWLKRDMSKDLGLFLAENELVKFDYQGTDYDTWSKRFKATICVIKPEDFE